MATTIAIWNDIYITCGGSTLSLMSTDLKCRVALQSAMMVDADDLIDNLKSNGLTLRIEKHGLHVELGDKEVELKTVLQLIGGFLDRYYVRESTKNDRLIFHDPATSTSWKVTKKTSAQSPVDDSRVECRAYNVKRKHKLGLAKWLIPIGIGVTTAIAAPIVIPAAVGALGFGAGGIVGGSLAASMMSAAAVANGGGVAAGGLIATLQSIGAVGAISASTAVTAGVAAGGASGAVVAVASKLSKDEDE